LNTSLPTVLVTGDAGYCGAQACLALDAAGYRLVGLDNLSTGTAAMRARVAAALRRPMRCHVGDVRDTAALHALMVEEGVGAVVHFAALKSVPESRREPARYADNNEGGARSLLQAMRAVGVRRLVFSSSAAVYGAPAVSPVPESAPLAPDSPYAVGKARVEAMIAEARALDVSLRAVSLRYFNPVGADPSGAIGEAPGTEPDNLMPRLLAVAAGRAPALTVYGGDWPTRDGSGVRDFLHVCDLARAHVAALQRLDDTPGLPAAINLGTGRGTTVLELVRAFEAATGQRVPVRVVGRREGDVAEVYADVRLAREWLGWRAAELDVARMCLDAWRWDQALRDRA
jgi:UDP-glucose 4-epimerase